LVKLYGFRWDVELDLKHLKTTLGMDILRSKTPEMVRKEIMELDFGQKNLYSSFSILHSPFP